MPLPPRPILVQNSLQSRSLAPSGLSRVVSPQLVFPKTKFADPRVNRSSSGSTLRHIGFFKRLSHVSYWCDCPARRRGQTRPNSRRQDSGLIVAARIMDPRERLNVDRDWGVSTARLEAHLLAGGRCHRLPPRYHRISSCQHRFGFRRCAGGRPRRW